MITFFKVILIIAIVGFFIYQLFLLIRDISKKIKSKKSKRLDDNNNKEVEDDG